MVVGASKVPTAALGHRNFPVFLPPHFLSSLPTSLPVVFCLSDAKISLHRRLESKSFAFKCYILVKCIEPHLKQLFILSFKKWLNERKNTEYTSHFLGLLLIAVQFYVSDSSIVNWGRKAKHWWDSITVVSHLKAHHIIVFLLSTGFNIYGENQ